MMVYNLVEEIQEAGNTNADEIIYVIQIKDGLYDLREKIIEEGEPL